LVYDLTHSAVSLL